MSLPPGTKLAHYEILEPIGKGGMGEVHHARDTKLGRDITIKVLREDLASDPERLRRFEQEARSTSALNQPNIIHIYDVGEHRGVRYIAMDSGDLELSLARLGGKDESAGKLIESRDDRGMVERREHFRPGD